MPRRKKEKESINVKRRMKTYFELEDGAIVEYYFSPQHEDEYGSWRDTTYEQNKLLKETESTYKKKIIASIAKVWETTTKHISYSKGDKIRIHETVETDDKEWSFKRLANNGYLYPIETSFSPDEEFCYENSYMNHFNLVKEGYGNNAKFLKRTTVK